MTDLEICRRIADIEDIYYMETKYTNRANFLGLVNTPDGSGTPPELIGEYNPLTDDGLCFRLMIRHNINLNVALFTDDSLHRYEAVNTVTAKGYGFSKNPNRAICLAIIRGKL